MRVAEYQTGYEVRDRGPPLSTVDHLSTQIWPWRVSGRTSSSVMYEQAEVRAARKEREAGEKDTSHGLPVAEEPLMTRLLWLHEQGLALI